MPYEYPRMKDFHQAWELCSFTFGKSHLLIIKSSVGLGEPSVLSFGEAVFYRKNFPLGLSQKGIKFDDYLTTRLHPIFLEIAVGDFEENEGGVCRLT